MEYTAVASHDGFKTSNPDLEMTVNLGALKTGRETLRSYLQGIANETGYTWHWTLRIERNGKEMKQPSVSPEDA